MAGPFMLVQRLRCLIDHVMMIRNMCSFILRCWHARGPCRIRRVVASVVCLAQAAILSVGLLGQVSSRPVHEPELRARATIALTHAETVGRAVVARSRVKAGVAQGPVRDRPASAATGTASIAGRVVVWGTTLVMPVRRARVTLEGDGLLEPTLTDTDTEGRYVFGSLPAGRYRIRADKPGFVTLELGQTRPFAKPGALDLKAREARTADLALPRGAALEGHIVNERGEPVENVTVSAVRLMPGPTGRRPMAMGQVRTDDLGRFRVHSLPPGDYYVDAAPDLLRAPGGSADARERRAPPAHTYYPGTPRVHEAQTVRVGTGQTLDSLEIGLTDLPAARLTVHILDASGHVPASAFARIQPVSGAMGGVRGTGRDGTFVFPNVAPGDYWVMAAASSTSAADEAAEFAAVRTTVDGHDLDDLTVRTERGARIDGHVEIDSGTAAPSLAGLQLLAHESEFELPSPRGPGTASPPIRVAPTRRFTIASLFGPRVMRLNRLPPGWALTGVWLDDRDITDVATDFRAVNGSRTLRLAITHRTASVVGTVAGDPHVAIEDARVIVFTDDERHWTPWSRFVKSVVPSAGGSFTVDGLLPGTYLACAVDYLEDDAWRDPDVLRRLRAAATPVSLIEGDTPMIRLTRRGLP